MSTPEGEKYIVGEGPYFYKVGNVYLSTDKRPTDEQVEHLQNVYGFDVVEDVITEG